MAYNEPFKKKAGTGNLFANKFKKSPNHPDYRGWLVTPKGEEVEISGWVKLDKNDDKMMSIAAQEPFKKPEEKEEKVDRLAPAPF